jgi:hypothetical protein
LLHTLILSLLLNAFLKFGNTTALELVRALAQGVLLSGP